MRKFVSNDSGTSYPNSFFDPNVISHCCASDLELLCSVGMSGEGKEVDNREMNDNAKRMEDSLLNSLANKEDEFGDGIQRNLRMKTIGSRNKMHSINNELEKLVKDPVLSDGAIGLVGDMPMYNTAHPDMSEFKSEREQHRGQRYRDIQPLESRPPRQYRRPRIPFSGIATSSLGITISTSQRRPPSLILSKISRYPPLGIAISPSSEG
ncbi:hypothetical protein Godav_010578 [Gossypium davidsonii]|uniref:Uncharacterized protein n=1 Tax=Gossypium davidsonii TaxID=34287 RepID=A0A7J8SHM3_GOSDV|nr:hypothetical protein [Gossypium davidsonii]